MNTIRWERRQAKRNHKSVCMLSGMPILKGDWYIESVTTDGPDIYYIKGHAILMDISSDMADTYLGWNPDEIEEYLDLFLNVHLGKRQEWVDLKGWTSDPEVQSCLDAARKFWKTGEP